MTLEEKVALAMRRANPQSRQSPSWIPELWMSDGPHGVQQKSTETIGDMPNGLMSSITAFPALTCLALTESGNLRHLWQGYW